MDYNAIETRYAGHHFRSRLEARWAVFFDHLGIKWQYEPQGYNIKVGDRKIPYLPDFYLPRHGTWVEVKGSRDNLGLDLLEAAVDPGRGLPVQGGAPGTRMLILGPIPEPGRTWSHWQIERPRRVCRDEDCATRTADFAKVIFLPSRGPVDLRPEYLPDGALTRGFTPEALQAQSELMGAVLERIGEANHGGPDRVPFDFTQATPIGFIPPFPAVEAALQAARSARFEHGESGAS